MSPQVAQQVLNDKSVHGMWLQYKSSFYSDIEMFSRMTNFSLRLLR